MMKLTDDLCNEVTIRRVTDRNSVQASEWKAVIFVRSLEEFLDESIVKNVGCAVDGDKTVLESALTLYSSTQYIPLSRARVYLTVIGKLGGARRETAANQHQKIRAWLEKSDKMTEDYKLYSCEYLSMHSEEVKSFLKDRPLMYKDEEYEHYKRNDFVYSVVDIDSAMLKSKPQFDDIWFDPLIRCY
jgi:hypothetical protein